MFIKHIICTVKPENRLAFSKAQKAWSKTKKSEGFIGQIGGWNVVNNNEARIVSFWDKKSHLDKFMKDMHDVISNKNNQEKTYESITVSHFGFDYPDNAIELFKQKLNKVKSIKTDYENAIHVNFLNDELWIKNKSLKQSSTKLQGFWKVI